MTCEETRIRNLLLEHGKTSKMQYEWPWLSVAPLTMKSANKFVFGAIIDFQVKADRAWEAARRVIEDIFGDPPQLWDYISSTYSKIDWEGEFSRFELHRFRWAHNRVWRIAGDIARDFQGDARLIWQGKSPIQVIDVLDGRLSVGAATSRMIVGALLDTGHLRGKSDLKPDLNVRRVLGRLFVGDAVSADTALTLSKKIHPDNPWELDNPLFDIGKRLCVATDPRCFYCPLNQVCRFGKI